MGEEVFAWLKSMPLAPEYHPTLIEFEDPISYIFKIEQEASKYGICKIIPPVSVTPKKTIISNLNRSLSSQTPDSSPTFTTRQQQIGYWPRKHLTPVQRSVWESGESYTLPQFELKAKNFEKNYLKKRSNSKKGLTDLDRETLYWKAQVDKPFSVEYANDMSCSAFDHGGHGGIGDLMNKRNKGIGDVMNVGESEWNMGIVSRAKGSLLKYLKEEIAGVNSPMVYIGMMFSWFAWHCEDHDLHSLNYMHMGAGKTWYGVPKDAAVAFEDVIRTHGYAGEISPIVTFATLVGKTTIMSPEVLLKAGIPCCRLVQNAGEFVVTFPRAYHSGFSHGFNCAEATNIATPGWLEVAQDAAIRRASIDRAPMVSHSQLLYDLACSFSTSVSTITRPGPRSSRQKDRLKADGEGLVKRLFIQDIIQNNELINILGKESPVTVLSEDSLDSFLNSLDSSLGSRSNADLNSDGVVVNSRPIKTKIYSFGVKTADPSCVFSCVTCGIPCHACVAIVQPNEVAARFLISADLSTFNEDSIVVDPKPSSEKVPKSTSPIGAQNVNSALGLLALAYGDSSDSEEEYDQTDSKSNKFVMESNCSTGRFEYQIEMPLNSSARDEDSSRMHIFCLEHAREVDQRLRSVGGVHMLLLCHKGKFVSFGSSYLSLNNQNSVRSSFLPLAHKRTPLADYPKLNDEARLMAEELGIPDHMWTDVGYKDINEHEKLMIKSALDNKESTYGKQDWAVRLGVDIFFSSRLCGTPSYRKQMPYNLVIYNTFCHTSPSNHPIILKTLGRQKKNTVAGVWCGKVWMSNQVHPMLVLRDDEEQKDRITNVSVFPKVGVKCEAVISKNVRKRKRDVKGHKKAPKFDMDSGDDSDYVPSREFGIRIKSKPKVKKPSVTKKAKKSVVIEISDEEEEEEEEEGEFGCDKDGCNMILESKQDLVDHKRNICLECGKKFISHNYLVQHRRVHLADRPLECPWKGCKMTFKWAWARTEHVRVHTGARPYVCTEVGCGKTFRFVSDNSRHKRKTGHYVKREDQ